MKKFVLFVLLTLTSVTISAQTDSIWFSEEQVLRIDNKIQELERKDSLNTLLIKELEVQNAELKDIIKRDSLILAFKNEELTLRETQVNLYLDLYKKSKPKWHENKYLWFGLGMVSVITSSWVVANTTP
jgi:hypothetical protein